MSRYSVTIDGREEEQLLGYAQAQGLPPEEVIVRCTLRMIAPTALEERMMGNPKSVLLDGEPGHDPEGTAG